MQTSQEWKHFLLCELTCANTTEARSAPAEADVGWSDFRSLHQLAGCLQGPSLTWDLELWSSSSILL